MKAQIYTQPTIEPITLAELKLHLGLDSGTFDGNLTLTQCLAQGSHAVADNYTTHVGTGVDVLGKEAIVVLKSGTNGATGTVDTRIEESDQLSTGYTAWTGGAFTQVTTANDNADYKKAYTGAKQYIRTASKVLLAACEFGTSVLVNAATTAEDTLLTRCIKSARRHIEGYTSRALLTQVWDYYLQEWPGCDYITVPFGNLQNGAGTAPVITWTDTAGTVTTLTVTTDYLVETNGEDCGRIVLPYGGTWPTGTLYPSNPIKIRFYCGWTAAADIPEEIINAVLLFAEDLYSHRELKETQAAGNVTANKTFAALLANYRLWNNF